MATTEYDLNAACADAEAFWGYDNGPPSAVTGAFLRLIEPLQLWAAACRIATGEDEGMLVRIATLFPDTHIHEEERRSSFPDAGTLSALAQEALRQRGFPEDMAVPSLIRGAAGMLRAARLSAILETGQSYEVAQGAVALATLWDARCLPPDSQDPFLREADPDTLFAGWLAEGFDVAEPWLLLRRLRDIRGRRTQGTDTPPLRIRVVGYDAADRQGFLGWLTLSVFPTSGTEWRLAGDPSQLLLPRDAAFERSLRYIRQWLSTELISSHGTILAWHLSRDDADLVALTGDSLGGAFATGALLLNRRVSQRFPRLVTNRYPWDMPIAVSAALGPGGRLLSVGHETEKMRAARVIGVPLVFGASNADTGSGKSTELLRSATVMDAARSCQAILSRCSWTQRIATPRFAAAVMFSVTALICIAFYGSSLWTRGALAVSETFSSHYDVAEQFSREINPEPLSVWTYGELRIRGEKSQGLFLPLHRSMVWEKVATRPPNLRFWYHTENDVPNVSLNDNPIDISHLPSAVVYPARTVSLHAGHNINGMDARACIRFTAPATAVYLVSGEFWGCVLETPPERRFFLLLDGQQLWKGTLAAGTNRRNKAVSTSLRLSLKRGQNLDLTLGVPPQTLGDGTTTAVRYTITRFAPEPTP